MVRVIKKLLLALCAAVGAVVLAPMGVAAGGGVAAGLGFNVPFLLVLEVAPFIALGVGVVVFLGVLKS